MTSTARTIDQSQTAKLRGAAELVDPLTVFLARCEARAHLVANGLYELQESVDTLQADAEAQGLVAKYGQTEVQRIMAEAFARWRLEDDG